MVACPGDGRAAVPGAGVDADEVLEVPGEDPCDPGVDLPAGSVVRAAEPVADVLELFFGLDERALAGGGDLAALLGGVDPRDTYRQQPAVLGAAQRRL